MILSGNIKDIPEPECEPDEVREERWRKQREERGFDDTELWNLNNTIIYFILPRLKAYREMERWGTPMGLEEKHWNEILDRIIIGFELFDYNWSSKEELMLNERKFKIAMKLFAKWFGALWD